MNNIQNKNYGTVAVLMGGHSGEREISLKSGAAVMQALQKKGVNAISIDVDENVFSLLKKNEVNHVFIALHGCGGEDGTMQGGLEILKMPYTGSGVLASAICMDKYITKQIWKTAHIPTPDFIRVNDLTSYESVKQLLGDTFIIKPSMEGSSLGVHIINNQTAFDDALINATAFNGQLMAEQWIEGDEYTVAILNDEALPVIKLKTPNNFYDYEAKYNSGNTQYILPCGLSSEHENKLKALARAAFNATQASGWGRIDVMMDKNNQPWFLEVNTVPGMTDHSLVPMAAASAGINFDQLVMAILDTALR